MVNEMDNVNGSDLQQPILEVAMDEDQLMDENELNIVPPGEAHLNIGMVQTFFFPVNEEDLPSHKF